MSTPVIRYCGLKFRVVSIPPPSSMLITWYVRRDDSVLYDTIRSIFPVGEDTNDGS